jgi:serine/threonine protein kinase
MTVDRWNRIEEIFQTALERPLSERSEYVARACGGDKELLAEVESLVASDSDAATTLRLLVENDIQKLTPSSWSSEAGLRIGPYQLIRELDSGGMGVVYLAVRSDDHYFQIVAIKMIRKGLEWPSLVRRFRAERQILANLTHPNIGAILDGGETEDRRRFYRDGVRRRSAHHAGLRELWRVHPAAGGSFSFCLFRCSLRTPEVSDPSRYKTQQRVSDSRGHRQAHRFWRLEAVSAGARSG